MKIIYCIIFSLIIIVTGCNKFPEDSKSSSEIGLNIIYPDGTPESKNSDEKSETDNGLVNDYNYPDIVVGNIEKSESMMSTMPKGVTHEVSPVFFNNGDKNYMISTTSMSLVSKFLPGFNILDIFFKMDSLESDARWITYPQYRNEQGLLSSMRLNQSDQWDDGVPYWNRNYYGIFDAQIAIIDNEEYLIFATHGENKNEKFYTGQKYTNTILSRQVYTEDQYSGVSVINGRNVYNDYPYAYFSFVGIMTVPVSEIEAGRFDAEEQDHGPVVWPETPYVIDQGSGVNYGVRHPSMYIQDDYIYLYYIENSYVKVARADLKDKEFYKSFMKYSNGNFENAALPENFNKGERKFLREGTTQSDNILGHSGTIRFSVTKIKNSEYYLGVEEYSTFWPKVSVRLRISDNLVNWSNGIDIPGTTYDNFHDAFLHYPVFLNSEGNSHKEIDLEEFYIMGIYGSNTGRNQPNVVKMSVSLE